ncbi:MAG: hypothetical protein CMJ24_10745, partial [Phycisphaerae bacterium]|nr:hypothetical protein [Phycisphaerae bacterium]
MQEQNGSTWNNLSAAVNTDVPIGSGGYEFTFDTAVSGRMYVVYNKGGGDGMVALCNADIANAECTAMSDFTECPKFFAESGCQSMLLPYALVEMTLAPNANSGDANLSDVDQHGIEVSMEVTTGTDTSRHNYNTSNANVLNGLKALLPTDSKAVVTNNSGDIVRVINPSHLPASANYAEIPQEYPSFKSYVDSLGADWSAQISSKVEDQEACPGAVGSFDMVATKSSYKGTPYILISGTATWGGATTSMDIYVKNDSTADTMTQLVYQGDPGQYDNDRLFVKIGSTTTQGQDWATAFGADQLTVMMSIIRDFSCGFSFGWFGSTCMVTKAPGGVQCGQPSWVKASSGEGVMLSTLTTAEMALCTLAYTDARCNTDEKTYLDEFGSVVDNASNGGVYGSPYSDAWHGNTGGPLLKIVPGSTITLTVQDVASSSNDSDTNNDGVIDQQDLDNVLHALGSCRTD